VDLTAPAEGDRPVFAENLHALMEYGWAPQVAVYEGQYKYIYSPIPELYDLSVDPLEKNNIHEDKPEVAAALHARLVELLGPNIDEEICPQPTHTLTEDELAALKAIGYTAGAAEDLPDAGDWPDPKEVMPIMHRVDEAVFGYAPRGDMDKAIALLEELTESHPDFLPTFQYLGLLYRENGFLDKAERTLQHYVDARPNATSVVYALATTQMALGDNDAARQLLAGIIHRHPYHFGARMSLGIILLQEADAANAATHFLEAFEVNPSDRACVTNLVRAMFASNRGEEVPTILQKKLEQDPRLPHVRQALADSLASAGRLDEAEAVLREGARLMPDAPDAVGGLATFLATRAPGEATALMERLCQRTGYKNARALYHLSVVYSVLGRFDEGLAIAEKAKALATEAGNKGLIKELENLMAKQARAKESGAAGQRESAP
jgi:tetratricopeptide (TPR) repeat protein